MPLALLNTPPTPTAAAAPQGPAVAKNAPAPTPAPVGGMGFGAAPPPPAAAPVVAPAFDNLLGGITPAPKPSPSQERKQRIEAEIGETVNVRLRDSKELPAAMQDGVIVKLFVKRGWRGTAKLTPAELGLEGELLDFATNKLRLGSKKLIPQKIETALSSSEVTARNALYAAGLDTPFGRFVPTRRFKPFKGTFLHEKERFFAALKELVDTLDQVREQIRKDYAPLAEVAWRADRNTWAEDGQAAGHYANQEKPTPLYTATFVERIAAQIPPAEDIIGKAEFRYEMHMYSAPDTTLAKQFATSDVDVQAELQEHLVDQKKRIIDDFLTSIRDGLAAQMSAFVTEVTQTIGEKKFVHKKTVDKILKTIADLRDLNVVNDTGIDEALQGLSSRVEIQAASGKVDAEQVKLALQTAVARVAEAAKVGLKGGSYKNLD